MSSAAQDRPGSEFDLQPGEWKLSCGCYAAHGVNGPWITGQKFECVHDHRLGQEVEADACRADA